MALPTDDVLSYEENAMQNQQVRPIGSYGDFYTGPSPINTFSKTTQIQQPIQKVQPTPQSSARSIKTPNPVVNSVSGSLYSNNLNAPNYQTFLDVLNSQKNKFIGVSLSSQPKKQNSDSYHQLLDNSLEGAGKISAALADADRQRYTNTYANYVEKNPEKTGVALINNNQTPKASNTELTNNTNWKTTLSTIQQSADAISKAKQTSARTEYNQDVADWKAKGQYWFDQNANLKPDIEKYMERMPSSVDALKEGSWVTSLQDGKTDTAGEYLSSVFINPAGGKSGNDTVDAILNPLNILEQQGWVDEGYVNYIGGKASEGAMSGGFVGAIIGIVDGIFSWDSAKKEDEKRRKTEREEYERKLEEWTFNTNKRLADAATARAKEVQNKQMAYSDKRKAEKATEKNQRISDIGIARKEMATALLNAGNVKSDNRNKRLARWGK